jgi:hypothetical protein
MSNIDSAAELSGEVSILQNAEGRNLSGSFKAKKLGFAGVSLEQAEGSFVRSGAELSISPVKGIFYGGEFSGNISVVIGDSIAYSASGVVENLSAEALPVLKNMLKGSGALVLQADTNGTDAISLAQNFSAQGTYVIPQGSFPNLKIASEVFNEETWKTLEGMAGVLFDAVKKQSISQSGDLFSNLNASYEFSQGNLKVSSATWTASKYSVEGLSAVISSVAQQESSDVRADAVAIVPKNISLTLTPDKAAREKILDNQERLVVPFKIAGNNLEAACTLDSVKLDELQKLRLPKTVPATKAPSEPVSSAKPSAVKSSAAEKEKTSSPVTKNPTTVEPAQPKSPKASPQKSSAPKEESTSDAESLTRIIIGQ